MAGSACEAYGRGRIIGDYRRVALYGIDKLIEAYNLGKMSPASKAAEDIHRSVGVSIPY